MPPTNSRNFYLRSRSTQFSAARRRFLQASAAAVSGVILSNCARNLSSNSASPQASEAADDQTLHIYTWANYTNDELLQSFQKKTGIQVVADTYDSNEAMLSKMEAGGGKAYSIIYPSDFMVEQMIEKEMLASLDSSRLQGMNNLMDKWRDPVYDPKNQHSVPTVWGTTGLIFNPAEVGSEIEGWDYIWDNTSDLNRRITLINDVREVLGATLKYLGYSYNSKDADEIKEAYNKLLEIKPAIASFLTTGWEDQLASGDLLISMAYSQDALNLIGENPDLKYIVPESGTSLWTDTMVIPKSAPNPDAAYEWINFLLEPDNAAMLVKQLNISTPNQAAYDKLPDNLKNDQNLFPSKAVLAKCEGIAPVPDQTAELYDQYWTQLTSS